MRISIALDLEIDPETGLRANASRIGEGLVIGVGITMRALTASALTMRNLTMRSL